MGILVYSPNETAYQNFLVQPIPVITFDPTSTHWSTFRKSNIRIFTDQLEAVYQYRRISIYKRLLQNLNIFVEILP